MAEYDVFLSHSSLDDSLAKDIKVLLEHNKISVFCTPTSIPSGKWEPQIEDALQNSHEIWVLLTGNALSQSVWVHQELGYFYGFRHGKGYDELGSHSRYLFETGTPQPGLYDQLQGTPVENLGDPEVVARTITESLEHRFELPDGWENHKYATSLRESGEDQELFREELLEMTKSELAESIRQNGHWEFSLRPADYFQSRLKYAEIYSTVGASYIKHRRWDFPSMDSETYAQAGEFWKGEEFSTGYREIWRMSQTGQYVSLLEFTPDGDELGESSSQQEPEFSPGELFSINSAVMWVTGVFEFAANLARNHSDWQPIAIEIRANNITGKVLATRRRTLAQYSTVAPQYVEIFRPQMDDLINNPHALAILYLENLFQRFGWTNPRVKEIQSALLEST